MRFALALPVLAADLALAQPATAARWAFGVGATAYGVLPVGGPSGVAFAGGATFLTVPSTNGGLGHAGASMTYSAPRGVLRIAAQAGDAIDAWAARDGDVGARRYVREISVSVDASHIQLLAGTFPARLAEEPRQPARDDAASPSILEDFAPRQQAGIWLLSKPVRFLGVEAGLLNGWETQSDLRPRALGARARLTLPAARVVGFYVNTTQENAPRRRLIGAATAADLHAVTAAAEIHLGSQENSSPVGRAAHWWGYAASMDWRVGTRATTYARFERFDDDKQIVLRTGSHFGAANAPFRGYSETLGAAVRLNRHLRWASEIRAFQNSGTSFLGDRGIPTRSTAWAMTSVSLIR